MKQSSTFETIRQEQFSRLDVESQVYLDYTGSGLYPSSLIRQHFDLLNSHILGNPHSLNSTSHFSTGLVNKTRDAILQFFNADPRYYQVIFTPNASGALKLVGECFPFTRASTFALLEDNHNSVQGIREFASRAGAKVRYVPIDQEMRVANDVERVLKKRHKNGPNLFAYPAQSNFSGVKHPLGLIHFAHSLGYYVLLDAAAYVPTNGLDLSHVWPDFVSISFYKMFGFPTGIGALIARKESLQVLRKPWFSGGTVQFVSVKARTHLLAESGPERFEDGTVNFAGIPAIMTGLSFLESIGMDEITMHVKELTRKLVRGLMHIRHKNGEPAICLYGPRSGSRGGTVNFDVMSSRKYRVDARTVEEAANRENISLRTGCFCNPGAAEHAHRMNAARIKGCLSQVQKRGPFTLERYSECMGEGYIGSVRVSLGVASVSRDVDRFVAFIKRFIREYEKDSAAEQNVQSEGSSGRMYG